MDKQQKLEAKIYREYINAKRGETSIIAKKYGVSRAGLYKIVRRVERGNVAMISRCTRASKLECLWNYKYETRILSLNKALLLTTPELNSVIRQMKKDGFAETDIARRLKKARTTIRYHLK